MFSRRSKHVWYCKNNEAECKVHSKDQKSDEFIGLLRDSRSSPNIRGTRKLYKVMIIILLLAVKGRYEGSMTAL
jgi:hypothetical protein